MEDMFLKRGDETSGANEARPKLRARTASDGAFVFVGGVFCSVGGMLGDLISFCARISPSSQRFPEFSARGARVAMDSLLALDPRRSPPAEPDAFGQWVRPLVRGAPLDAAAKLRAPLSGRTCRLAPADPLKHATDLFNAFANDDGRMWAYLNTGPFHDEREVEQFLRSCADAPPEFRTAMVVEDAASGRAEGFACIVDAEVQHACVEIGLVAFSPRLQKTTKSTEALFLMIERAFELGFRRVQWRCNTLNDRAKAAARRLGFLFEGCLRERYIFKGRTRDTEWYSMLASEWPAHRDALVRWLRPENFNERGAQILTLDSTRAAGCLA